MVWESQLVPPASFAAAAAAYFVATVPAALYLAVDCKNTKELLTVKISSHLVDKIKEQLDELSADVRECKAQKSSLKAKLEM